MRVGTCPHCRGDITLTEQPCTREDCPIPGFDHSLILCAQAGCPHPEAMHVFTEANLERLAPAIATFTDGTV